MSSSKRPLLELQEDATIRVTKARANGKSLEQLVKTKWYGNFKGYEPEQTDGIVNQQGLTLRQVLLED